MHYKCLLITTQFPTTNIIATILEPFNSENYYAEHDDNTKDYPAFMWDWYQIGGRYNGAIKLRCDQKNNEKYRWEYIQSGGRNGICFWSYLLTKMQEFSGGSFRYIEDDYYPSMGSRDGYLYVDSAIISDILNFDDIESYCCIDKNGAAYSRESWNGDDWIVDQEYDAKIQNVKKNSSECFATIIDLHD